MRVSKHQPTFRFVTSPRVVVVNTASTFLASLAASAYSVIHNPGEQRRDESPVSVRKVLGLVREETGVHMGEIINTEKMRRAGDERKKGST